MHSHLQLAAIRSELETRVSERTAALEESRETFKRLSELLQVGVHRSDREGKIVWANKKWFKTLGLEDGQWDGKPPANACLYLRLLLTVAGRLG